MRLLTFGPLIVGPSKTWPFIIKGVARLVRTAQVMISIHPNLRQDPRLRATLEHQIAGQTPTKHSYTPLMVHPYLLVSTYTATLDLLRRTPVTDFGASLSSSYCSQMISVVPLHNISRNFFHSNPGPGQVLAEFGTLRGIKWKLQL